MTLPRLAALAVAIGILEPTLIQAQAERRTMFVSALDQRGAPLDTLAATDVVVREDKAQREVLEVVPADDPMQIALLVDNSQAADSLIRDYREALAAFVNAIVGSEPGPRHQISIITIGERPTINTEYTSDVPQLLKGVQRIFAMSGSGTYLLDAIIETSRGISKRRPPRPVIVAIVTEGPELSDRVYQAALEPLLSSGAAFHVIVVGRPTNNSHDRSIVLAQGSRKTGGRYDNILTSTALTARMKEVAAELTHQFRVTYARPQSLIPPEEITVTAAKPGLNVRGTAKNEVPKNRQ